jgi:hypothetical protein
MKIANTAEAMGRLKLSPPWLTGLSRKSPTVAPSGRVRIDKLKATMTSVATGGPQIQRVEAEFVALYNEVDSELRSRGIEDGLSYRSLWDWYGRWSQGDLPTDQSRREFLNDAFSGLIKRVRKPGQQYEPTGN